MLLMEGQAALNFAKARDIERAHATQAAPFAGDAGVHHAVDQPNRNEGAANDGTSCACSERSCSRCA